MRVPRIAIAAVAAALAVSGCASAGPGGGSAPSASAPGATDSAPPAPSASSSVSMDATSSVVTPLTAPELSSLDTLDMVSGAPFAARWREPGTELAVFIGGSGMANCTPAPTGATVAASGDIVVTFKLPGDAPEACTLDFGSYGWAVELPANVDGDAPVNIVGAGLETSEGAEPPSITLAPDQVMP